MIKGVSRYAVEIDKTDSPFFDKVICFVRPQYVEGNALDLHREAVRMVNNLSSGVEEAQKGSQHVLKVQPEAVSRRKNSSSCAAQSSVRSRNSTFVKSPKWLPFVLSAGGGAAAALLLSAIF